MLPLRNLLSRVAALVAVMLIAACTSTPEATPERDALAKEFLTHPNASTIYVYRSEFNHYDTDSVLYLDGRVIGTTVPGAYFRLDTTPGRHVLHGTGIDLGNFTLETRAGEIYFVSVNINGGHSNFEVVPEAQGRERVRACCALLENWAPGQRPFLVR
jgi:hypothetical protein